jgi:hypothetical protein
MWRSVFIVVLLAASPALAGQARGTFQVGITITGTTARPAAKAGTVGSGQQAVTRPQGAAKEPQQ